MQQATRRQFGLGAGALALASGAEISAHADDAANAELLAHINPELRPMIAAAVPRMTAAPSMTRELLIQQRAASAAHPPRPPADARGWCVERVISGRNGAPDIKIYVVNANAAGAPRPAIVHMHGGGFITRSAAESIRMLHPFTTALDCVAVTVEYRLAPETRFPGALEDNYAALKWLYTNAAELGVDRNRIAVMGESAGGGHAAMLAIAARDRGEVPIVYQALIYPMLDDRTGSTRQPAQPYIGALIWRPADNRFGWTSLLGVPAGSRHVPASAVPARVENLRGLPPAFIGVGSIDLFADEDIEYARRLLAAGVSTELIVVPGAFHGFDFVTTAPIVQQFNAALTHALRSAFGAS